MTQPTPISNRTKSASGLKALARATCEHKLQLLNEGGRDVATMHLPESLARAPCLKRTARIQTPPKPYFQCADMLDSCCAAQAHSGAFLLQKSGSLTRYVDTLWLHKKILKCAALNLAKKLINVFPGVCICMPLWEGFLAMARVQRTTRRQPRVYLAAMGRDPSSTLLNELHKHRQTRERRQWPEAVWTEDAVAPLCTYCSKCIVPNCNRCNQSPAMR